MPAKICPYKKVTGEEKHGGKDEEAHAVVCGTHIRVFPARFDAADLADASAKAFRVPATLLLRCPAAQPLRAKCRMLF